jgi:hypothetical protein
MNKKLLAGAVLSAGYFIGLAQAQQAVPIGPHVTGHIQGYECMGLKAGPVNETWDDLPRVLAEPRRGAAEVGIATDSVIVKNPHVLQNGYLQVLHMDGRPGWVEAKVLEPWVNNNAPGVRCVPAMMSNGRPGFDYIRPRR